MRKFFKFSIFVLVIAFVTVGCAYDQYGAARRNRPLEYGIGGAAAGAGLGAAIAKKNPWMGAAIGLIGGGIVGAVVGSDIDRTVRERAGRVTVDATNSGRPYGERFYHNGNQWEVTAQPSGRHYEKRTSEGMKLCTITTEILKKDGRVVADTEKEVCQGQILRPIQ